MDAGRRWTPDKLVSDKLYVLQTGRDLKYFPLWSHEIPVSMIFHYTWALPLVTSLRLSVHVRLTMAITTWQDWYVWYRYIAMSHSMWIYVSLSKEFNATRDTIMAAHTFSLDWSECSVIIVRCGGRPCCSCSVQLSVVHGNITDKPHDGIMVCVFLMSAKPMTKTLQKNLIEDTKIANVGG